MIITHDDDTGTSYKSPVQSLKDDIKTQEEDDKAVAKKYRKEADRRSEQKAEINSIKKDAEKDVKQALDKARKQAEEYERKIERLKSERDELKRQQSSVKPSKETKDVAEDVSKVNPSTKPNKETTSKASNGRTFNATYYSAFCPTGCTGVTATGDDVSSSIYVRGKRVVAVDPNVIPLGSLVRVTTPNESFEALALDTGGNIKGNRIDILVESTKKAYSIGRHDVKVEILN